MKTHHSTLHTLQRIDFDPDSFTPGDLLWLPHHAKLARSGKKRQTEHLAGRIAAVHALRAFGEKSVPGIGKNRQPIWPEGLYGSISHCGNTAIAIVARTPVGIDIEAVFSPQLADELASLIASEEELAVLRHSTLPFPLALTLAFSAKESLYKAFSSQCPNFRVFMMPLPSVLTRKHSPLSFPPFPSLRHYAGTPLMRSESSPSSLSHKYDRKSKITNQ
ncbi:hypothetical protein CEW81_17980 [Kluyvera genomosp. 3]|uniref:Enterobactin synthase component D n=1 Tax=Kluyvera genomosp. 3 TaxID=2774055 RepID=A0A248KKT0_9ENTR|nr:hypothetical protein CEW81_17980 [Kluyvera genomosp. 3]